MRDRILVFMYVAIAALPIVATAVHAPKPQISGVVAHPERPAISAGSFVHETFQPKLAAWFEGSIRIRGYALIAENTLFAQLHEAQQGADVAFGDRGVLFSPDDLGVYNRAADELPSQASIDAMADKLALVQAHLAARHQALVPVLVPNKTTIYRDAIPDRWTRDLGMPRPNDAVYERMRHALEVRHIAYVDARPIILSEARDRMWTSTARHWSFYTACLAMHSTMAIYATLTARPAPAYNCEFELVTPSRDHDDLDLWRLLNALGTPPTIPVPAVAPGSGAHDLRALFVGSSFCATLVKDAQRSGAFGKVVHDFYNRTFVEGETRTDVHPNTDEWRKVALGNDLYVLDLYETFLPGSPDFLDELDTELR